MSHFVSLSSPSCEYGATDSAAPADAPPPWQGWYPLNHHHHRHQSLGMLPPPPPVYSTQTLQVNPHMPWPRPRGVGFSARWCQALTELIHDHQYTYINTRMLIEVIAVINMSDMYCESLWWWRGWLSSATKLICCSL